MQPWGQCCLGLVVFFLTLSTPVQAQDRAPRGQASGADQTVQYSWGEGLRLQTADEAVKLRLGGRLQLDGNVSHFHDDLEQAFGNPEDRVFVRRARLNFGATFYECLQVQLEIDFADGDAAFQNLYVQYTGLPVVGRVRFGLFNEPFGLEQVTSNRDVTFQERSLTDAFVPAEQFGMQLTNTLLHKRLTWTIAATRNVANYRTLELAGSSGDANVTLRLTGLPWYVDEGRRLVHVGLAYSFRNPPDNVVQYRARPEALLDDIRFVDTGELAAKTEHRVGVEGALVLGAFSLQGEFITALPQTTLRRHSDPTFMAFYVLASLFLTGEHRPYDTSGGIFGRLKPRRSIALQGGGLGAWEVAARLSHIDLQDASAFNPGQGGEETNVTLGVNWYLNPALRLTWNYVFATVDRRLQTTNATGNATALTLDGDTAHLFMMRVQVEF